jgi:hypothetical protein
MQTDLDLSRGKGKHQSQSEQFGAAGRAGLWHRVSATELWEKGLKPRFAWVAFRVQISHPVDAEIIDPN